MGGAVRHPRPRGRHHGDYVGIHAAAVRAGIGGGIGDAGGYKELDCSPSDRSSLERIAELDRTRYVHGRAGLGQRTRLSFSESQDVEWVEWDKHGAVLCS